MNILNFRINKDEFINEIYPKICPSDQYVPSILPPVKRIVVIGDIHGDYNLLIKLLQIANVININKNDGNLIWTGQNTYVIQVGDQIDRCRPFGNMLCSNPLTTYQDEASDIKIMKTCNELHKQAILVGGAFISLLGNHEIMGAMGILDYVSYLGMREFDNYIDPENPTVKFESGEDARKYAFGSGHEIGKMMGCTRVSVITIGKHLFVHAGIIDALIDEIGLSGIDDLEIVNISMRMWLLGLLKNKYIKPLISKNSMFWTRILGNIPPNVNYENPVCITHIGKVLKLFNIENIIIAHTPQSFIYDQDINKTCDHIFRVDNGSSSAFHKFDINLMKTGKTKHSRRPQVLEIIDDDKYFILDGVTRREIL